MQDDSIRELKQYNINIKGHKFTVSSEYTDDQIREVEAFLVQKIDEVASRSDTYNLMSLTVLVALNLADDLLSIRNNKSYIAEDVEQTLVSLCESLDKVVKSGSSFAIAPDAN